MAKQTYTAGVVASIDAQIAGLEQQQAKAQERWRQAYGDDDVHVTAEGIGGPGGGSFHLPHLPTHDEAVSFYMKNQPWLEAKMTGESIGLDVRIRRLQAVRDWMMTDPELGRFVDAAIGQQVKAAEHRQRMFAFGLGIVSLVIGWLLSAISPAHLLLR